MLSDHILYSHDFSDWEGADITKKFNADHYLEREGLKLCLHIYLDYPSRLAVCITETLRNKLNWIEANLVFPKERALKISNYVSPDSLGPKICHRKRSSFGSVLVQFKS